MTNLEKKLVDSYTVLVMAEEITLEDVPETVLTTGNTLRYEVELEQARRTVDIVPEPVDYKLPDRVIQLEKLTEIQKETIKQLEETISMQDVVIEEILFNIIPGLGELGGIGGDE